MNKSMTYIPKAMSIFFHLPEARVDLLGLDGLQHTDEPHILHHFSSYIVLVSSIAFKPLVLGMYWKRK